MDLSPAASILELGCPDLEAVAKDGCEKSPPQKADSSALSKSIAGDSFHSF